MILISTGTIHYPFPRLLETAVEVFSESKMLKKKETVILQTGNYALNSPLAHLLVKPLIPLVEMIELYQKADLIITAAGEASAHLLLHYAKNQPVLFPRNPKYSEHIDNQQVLIADVLSQQQRAVSILEATELGNLLRQYLDKKWVPAPNTNKKLRSETSQIISYLQSIS